LESVIRQCDGYVITEEHIRSLANWNNGDASETEVPFKPARVILQDFTGVPAIVDLASMRKAMQKANGDTHSSLPIYLCKFYENDFHIILF
jgi:aconitate hydratase